MLRLRQKAHAAMEDYERQRGSPSRYGPPSASSPADDNDELSLLGGKTRLVGKRESSLMDRSPTSRNPVVPLPLPSHGENHFDQSVWEYLDSFSRAQPNGTHLQTSPKPASPPNSLAQMDVPPSSAYGMAVPPSYQSESQYMHHSPPHGGVPSSPPNILQSHAPFQRDGGTTIPQYFHVYDYPASTVNGNQRTPPLGTNSGSGSPNMHSMWQDFVHHVAM